MTVVRRNLQSLLDGYELNVFCGKFSDQLNYLTGAPAEPGEFGHYQPVIRIKNGDKLINPAILWGMTAGVKKTIE
jgi:hypothetical protein